MDPDESDRRITEALRQADDAPRLHGACRELADSFGFQYYFYAVRLPLSFSDPYHFCLSGYPPEWRKRYDTLGYLRVDPIVRHLLNSSLPLIWDDIDRHEAAVEVFFHEAADYGLAHGVSAPVAGRHGEIALMSLARGPEQPISHDPVERHRLCTRLHWMATVLHESVRRLVLNHEGAPRVAAPLSEREKDCLMWAADGKTTIDIGRALNITERTVLFHIESAGKKLGVSGRHNIISRAVALGEIELHQHSLRSLDVIPVMHE
ncbi:MAG: autoinducer binding domain-containing protein [Panacagrimonas sp.]